MTSSPQFREIANETAKTIKIGLPLVAAQLAQMSMGFVDTIMAGNFSPKDLAAVAVGFSLFMPLLVFSIGVLLGSNAVVAQLFGAQKSGQIGKNVWQSLWLSQMLALPGFLILRNMIPLMRLMNIETEIIPITDGYLKAISWGVPAYFAYFAFRFVNEGLSVTKPSMYIAFTGLIFNIIGNYAFMYGHFGFPAMGAVGTGWASTLVWWLMAAGIGWFTLANKNYKSIEIRQGLDRPRWGLLKEILRIGLPSGISLGIEVSMFALVALIIGSLGVNNVAGHQIAINVASITFMIPLALSNATTARVGFAIGKGDPLEARRVGYIGIGLSLFAMSLAAVFMFTMPDLIARIYTADETVKEVAVKLLFLAAVFQISDGLQVSAIGALRGLKDTRVPMMVNIVSYWIIGLPTGYLLGIMFQFGVEGLWVGLIAGLTAAALLHNLRFHKLTRRACESAKISPRVLLQTPQ